MFRSKIHVPSSLFSGFLFLVSSFFSPSPAHATSEFTTAIRSTYHIQADGSGSVLHEIDIRNNLAYIYTREYTLAIGSDRLTHLKATGENGTLPMVVDQNGNATTMTVTVPTPVIGKDKVLHLEISYAAPDLAENLGQSMTVNIPRMSKGNEAASYERLVYVPSSFPSLAQSTPKPDEITPVGGEILYAFRSNKTDALTLLFGDTVTYRLELTYQVQADGSGNETEIALPPDTAYQAIQLESLSPAPEQIVVDPDGNWLARYQPKPKESLTIQATLFATVAPLPRFHDPGETESVTTLTKPTAYWETKNPKVSELAARLKTPENMYSYLVNNVRYNKARIKVGAERLGAVRTLDNPLDALCTEYTDTFVALARSQNIPAREINGYAYSTNPTTRPLSGDADVLHAWPEYYDAPTGVWYMIDPTWGSTTGGMDYFSKLDFNHITFVRHGHEAEYPLPAGSYKSDASVKQVVVTIADQVPPPVKNYHATKNGSILVFTNQGNKALVQETVSTEWGSYTVPYLPPYGNLTFTSPKESWWSALIAWVAHWWRK
jgi:transglutaminase-like putative cysteine protease